jgi:hypothetical protein
MVATSGNKKYEEGVVHPRCVECAAEEIAEAELAIRFNNDQARIDAYKKLIEKEKRIKSMLQ